MGTTSCLDSPALRWFSYVARPSQVVHRLLLVAASDMEGSIRQATLEALDERFDPFLCEPAHIAILQQALHDESIATRKARCAPAACCAPSMGRR